MAGRKPHIKDEKSTKQAEELAVIGLPQDQIAVLLGMSESTLKKYYAEELTRGKIRGNSLVAGWAMDSARKGNIPMRIFLAKVRLGWRERDPESSIREEPIPTVKRVVQPLPEKPDGTN